MALDFNPLDYPQSLSLPKRFGTTASHEHIPFIKLLVHLMRPKIFVELGVAKGDSYLGICEAISALSMKISAFGVDTWKGDSEQISLGNLRVQHDAAYGQFSRLVESTFDEAAAHFSEGSVELLHIDGNHNYEAVCHDWETFRPKMSRSGVVLFHFTNRREGDYGVWKLWEQLRSTYRHFEFLHGHGLGVLVLSPGISESLNVLLTMAEKNPGVVRSYFFALGNRITLHAKAGSELAALQALEARVQQFEANERNHADELERIVKLSQTRADELDALKRLHGDELASIKRAQDDERAAIDRAHSDIVAKHDRHSKARTDEIETLTINHASETVILKRGHSDEVESLKRAHSNEADTLKRVHADETAHVNAVLAARSAEIEKLDQSNRARADEIDALTKRLRTHEEDNEKLNALCQTHSENAEKLTGLHQSRVAEVAQLDQTCRSRAEEIDVLKRASLAHVDEIDELNRLCQTHLDDAERAAQVSAARAAEIEKLEKAARVQAEAIETLNRQCRSNEAELARLNSLAKSRADEIEKLERNARARSQELDEKEQLFKMQSDDTEKIARSHADAVATLQRTQSDTLAALERTRANELAKVERTLADDAAKLDRLIESRAGEIERLNAKIDEREESVRARDVELLLQKDKVEKLLAEIAELREAKMRLQSDPSFKLGHTLLTPFRFFSEKRTASKALTTSKQPSPGTKT